MYIQERIHTTSLKNYSSLNIGGEGELIIVSTLALLIEIIMYARKEEVRLHILGEGTNTFFGNDLKGILFVKMAIKGISLEEGDDSVMVTASSGESWDSLVAFCVNKNLWGIENLSLIPGTVGAAPVQNIGAYGASLSDVLVSISALDTKTLNVVEISKEGCDFGYRDSLFKKNPGRYIILSVTLKLSKITSPQLSYKPLDTLLSDAQISLQTVRDLVITTRQAKLPDWRIYPNSGSFFKNPVVTYAEGETLRDAYSEIPLIKAKTGYKIPAAWLIEHVANMKGVRKGDVGTWETQPLVLVNYKEATADELDLFKQEIQDTIYKKTGILLEQEVNRIG